MTSNVDKLIQQHEESKSRKNSNNFSNNKGKGVDFSKYFSTFLPKGEDEGQRTVRILPHPEKDTPFEELFLHTANVDGQNRKFICLEKNFDQECPFCEAAKTLRRDAENDEEKKLARDYDARLYYVVRVIDRDNEDRIKFWRFKDDYRNEGIFDKIMGIVKAKREDITHPDTGRDLVLNLNRNRQGFVTVSSIIDKEPSPVFDDENEKNKWLEDNRSLTWKEAYSVKDKGYLEIIVTGGVPAYDRETGTFYDKKKESSSSEKDSSEEETTTFGGAETPSEPEAPKKEEPTTTSNTGSEGTGNDLPF